MKFREFIKWLIHGIPTKEEFVRDMYKEMDRERKKNNEVWHYNCENGHKWESYSSPGGGVYAPATTCPECKSEVCMGDVWINGKKTQMGAIHCAYGLKGKKKENKLKELKKEVFLTKIKYGK